MGRSVRYQICVRVNGELASSWSAVLGDLAVTAEPDGTTLVTGELADQAAVHGLLGVIRDLGLSLVAVETSVISASAPRSGGSHVDPARGQSRAEV